MRPSPSQLSLFVTQEAVSKAALLLFRDLVGLSKRAGYGFINTIHSLVRLLGRDISERRLWQLIAELKAAGWISWEPVRRRGERGIKFAPLVRLPKQIRGRFAPQKSVRPEPSLPVVGAPFSCPKSAPSIALSNAKSCTLNPSTPYKTSPVGTEDDNRLCGEGASRPIAISLLENPVAVSLLENVVSRREAQELAREATKKALTAEQIKRVLEAYRGQATNIRNRGGWLREAIRRGFAPAAPTSIHASDSVGSAPVAKVVKVPALPTVQPGRELLDAKRDPALLKIMQKCSTLAKAQS